MMRTTVASALVASASASGTLALTFTDCGDSSTHAVVKDIEPKAVVLGQETDIKGTGTVDEAVTGGSFEMKISAAGIINEDFTGDICSAKSFDIKALGVKIGSISWGGMACPIAAGAAEVPMSTTLASALPAALASTKIALTAKSTSGDNLICVDINLKKQESWESIVADVNSKAKNWEAAVPDRFSSVEEAAKLLGAFLPGDEKYAAPAVREVLEASSVPENFDSREQWPHCGGMADVRDQSACGSCWAFGSTDSFQDRACAATGKDVRYSAEDTAFCSDAGFGCDGGNSAWDWFQGTGVVTGGDYTDIGSGSTCLPYSLAPCAHHVPATSKYPECPSAEYPSPSCKRACSEQGYSGSYSSDKVRASSAYSVQGVKQIQTELMNNGPLYVAFEVYADFPTYKSGVYKHTSGSFLGGHAVEVMGWGTMNGEDYWLVKNSWNEQWGDNGFFKIARGTDECGIEDSVSGGEISATVAV